MSEKLELELQCRSVNQRSGSAYDPEPTMMVTFTVPNQIFRPYVDLSNVPQRAFIQSGKWYRITIEEWTP